MAIVDWMKKETVGIITMNAGENRQNPDYVRAMLGVFEAIEKDGEVSSVVITSSDRKNWSLGIDVQWMAQAMNAKDAPAIRDFMYGMNRVYRRVLLFPTPVIAAINGHAFGGGTILACACDFRFMKSDRGFFCFPEIDISIPFLPGMLAIIAKAVPATKLTELVLTGKRAVAAELEAHHVIVKTCENEEALMQEATAFAKTFAKKRAIFGEMKRRLHKRITDTMDAEDPAYIDPLNLMI